METDHIGMLVRAKTDKEAIDKATAKLASQGFDMNAWKVERVTSLPADNDKIVHFH